MYPEGGLSVGSSIGLAGRLWLLAQGGSLTLASGRLVLAPLLLTSAIAWGLSRAAREVVRANDVSTARDVGRCVAVTVAGHVVLTLLLGLALTGPHARVGLLRTLAGSALLGLLAAGWGAGRESGQNGALLDRLPGPARPLLRGVLAGLLTALALCTAVVAVALISDAAGYAAVNGSLGGGVAGALGLLALGLLLLPNAAAAVLGLASGPGFLVGSATAVSVHGVTLGALPALPLLAALPDTQAVPLIAFASQAVPALAGLVAGTGLGRWFPDEGGGSIVAGLTGLLAGAGLGVAAAALTAVGGGSLGDGSLAAVGAPPLATGVAVALQSAPAAALAAMVSRWRAGS